MINKIDETSKLLRLRTFVISLLELGHGNHIQTSNQHVSEAIFSFCSNWMSKATAFQILLDKKGPLLYLGNCTNQQFFGCSRRWSWTPWQRVLSCLDSKLCYRLVHVLWHHKSYLRSENKHLNSTQDLISFIESENTHTSETQHKTMPPEDQANFWQLLTCSGGLESWQRNGFFPPIPRMLCFEKSFAQKAFSWNDMNDIRKPEE